jgi:phosphoribosyl 1,2-cyclic phosphodiesterase
VVESCKRLGAGDPTRVLVDCGLGLKVLGERLEERGLALTDLDAIFVTHEHGDHIGGVARAARKANIPVLLSHGTFTSCNDEFWSGVRVCEIDSHAALEFGALTLHCFPVPHDAREPVQLVVQSGEKRLGVLTDLGKSTPFIESMLNGLDAFFLEANHDEALLANSDYPPALKSRIAGGYGHLSNTQSAQLLSAIDQSRLQVVIAAHLSRHNNTPELATEALRPVLNSQAQLRIANQQQGFDWVELA